MSEEVLARLSELNRAPCLNRPRVCAFWASAKDVRLTQIMENLKILQRLVSSWRLRGFEAESSKTLARSQGKRKAKSSVKTE